MWLRRGHPTHSNRIRYLAYGFAYYLFATIILINLAHISSRPPTSKVVHLDRLDPTPAKPRTAKPRTAVSKSPATDWIARYAAKNGSGAEDGFYALRSTKINAFVYDAVVRPDVVCAPDVFIVIIVHSHHPNFEKRSAIRDTWGSVVSKPSSKSDPLTWPTDGRELKKKIRLLFILGVHKDPGLNDQVWEESLKHKDIIQGNFLDSYRNMTLKSLLGLKILLEFCSKAEYLLKSDDDMFLNLPHFIDTLEKKPLRHSILGPLSINARVYRSGKWKLTKEEFPFDLLPPYESGAAYVISRDLWNEILTASDYVPMIHIDDVYVTGILGKILNVTHVKLPGFAFWNGNLPNICDIIYNKIFTSTKMTPDILRLTWKNLSDTSLCKKKL